MKIYLINRNKIKEREKEDALYEGKEKFITSAYKRKLEADRKYLDDIRKREEQNKNNKSTFLTHLLNARTDEPKPVEQIVKEPQSSQVEEHKNEDEDEFEGFIMAPPEDQIKGNVSSDDAGFIMEPKESSHSHSRYRSRSRSRSHHRHHHHHHHHYYI